MRNKKTKLSPIASFHYIRLFCRSLLFLAAVLMYVLNRINKTDILHLNFKNEIWILAVIWVAYAVEMALRFFPAKLESMGCQKQFSRNYKPTGTTEKPTLTSKKRVWAVVAAWAALNGCIGALYFAGVIDRDVLVLISLAYGVCDMICILFFCPFQEWFLKNRCCTVCHRSNDLAQFFGSHIAHSVNTGNAGFCFFARNHIAISVQFQLAAYKLCGRLSADADKHAICLYNCLLAAHSVP